MKNWSLNKKVWGVFGILCAAFILSTTISIMALNDTAKSLKDITEVFFKRYQLTAEFKDAQRTMMVALFEVIARDDKEDIETAAASFAKSTELFYDKFEAYKAIASPEGRALAEKYGAEFEKFLLGAKKAQSYALDGKDEDANRVLSAVKSHRVEMVKVLDEINTLTMGRVDSSAKEANADVQRTIIVGIVVSFVSIAFSLMVAYFVLKSLMGAIALVVKNLSDSSIQVSGAATQIASSSEELSQAATEQAASLEETAASVEEMNSMVNKNTENAKATEQTSGQSQQTVNQGKTIIQKMMESMQAINASSEGMAETVKVIEQIDKKTKVINEIVNKTELLSFNASVEAARAGEHGKGFAVVAEEVGNLARMSGSAAEEIASLLETSIQKVNEMVATTKKNVETGTNITRECGDVFEEVVKNVNAVSGMATDISSASEEQSRGIAEITKAMSQLDQMTQQNAATSEQCASAAEELSAQAEALKNAVSHLVLTINGSKEGSGNVFTATSPTAEKQKSKPLFKKENVVHMKNRGGAPKQVAQQPAPALKKVSGDIPDYDSDGFTDI